MTNQVTHNPAKNRYEIHVDGTFAGFTVRAVVPGRGQARLELGPSVAGHDAVEARATQPAHRLAVWGHEQLGTDVRSVDDGGERHGLLGSKRVPQRVVDACAHQSSASTKTWIVPPHVSPTANASSSE